MTEPVQRPSPAAALQARFAAIQQQHMRDMPMVNPALEVEALGFRHWRDHWLGILVTPWFMNLVLMPRLPAQWQPLPERESRHHVFPAGVFEFIGGRDPALGDYQACSLFSPMFEFADQAGARATALAALDALFDAAHREPGEVPLAAAPAAPTATTEAPAAKAVSKRSFLFGSSTRADRGP